MSALRSQRSSSSLPLGGAGRQHRSAVVESAGSDRQAAARCASAPFDVACGRGTRRRSRITPALLEQWCFTMRLQSGRSIEMAVRLERPPVAGAAVSERLLISITHLIDKFQALRPRKWAALATIRSNGTQELQVGWYAISLRPNLHMTPDTRGDRATGTWGLITRRPRSNCDWTTIYLPVTNTRR